MHDLLIALSAFGADNLFGGDKGDNILSLMGNVNSLPAVSELSNGITIHMSTAFFLKPCALSFSRRKPFSQCEFLAHYE